MSDFISAIIGALIAAVPVWYTWLYSARRSMERGLLSEALAVQALLEAWQPEHEGPDSKLSRLKSHLPPEELRNVEVRAVLDPAPWNYPGDTPPCYGFIQGRRAWIVRDQIIADAPLSYSGGEDTTVGSKPALLSSRGIEELCGWIERVASARDGCSWFNQMLTDHGVRILKPLLDALAGQDRTKAFGRRLSDKAHAFLADYRKRFLSQPNSGR